MGNFIASAIVRSFKKKVDRSYSITIETMELKPNQLLAIDSLYEKNAVVTISENTLSFDDIKDEVEKELSKEPPQKKSQSQRLRGVLYLLWKQEQPEEHPEFDTYYRLVMEKLINLYSNKID